MPPDRITITREIDGHVIEARGFYSLSARGWYCHVECISLNFSQMLTPDLASKGIWVSLAELINQATICAKRQRVTL